jgi:hypothetical protein
MINDLKTIRDRLNAIIEAQEKPQVKEPDLMSGYMLYANGGVESARAVGETLQYLQTVYAQGNWFPTREEAEAESRKRAIRQKMRGFIKTPVSNQWHSCSPQKWSIFIKDSGDMFVNDMYSVASPTLVAFGSKEDAQACLDAMRSEIEELFV